MTAIVHIRSYNRNLNERLASRRGRLRNGAWARLNVTRNLKRIVKNARRNYKRFIW